MIKKILWVTTVLSLLASIPLVADRYIAEHSANQVEAIVDFDEIYKLSQRVEGGVSEEEILNQFISSGVTSVAFNENTLNDLAMKGYIHLYDAGAIQSLSSYARDLPEPSTLVLFSESLTEEEKGIYSKMIKHAFPNDAADIVWDGKQGIIIGKSPYMIDKTLVGLDFNAIKRVTENHEVLGIARLRSNRIWNEALIEWQFQMMNQLGIKKIVFDGKEVLGFPSPEKMKKVSGWMNQYQMGFGLIEFYEQNGSNSLGKSVNLRTVRLLSLSDREIGSQSIEKSADTYALGITERNIRMIYVHLPMQDVFDTEFILARTKGVVEKTAQLIQEKGYRFGEAKPFQHPDIFERGWQDLILIIGGLSLTSLLAFKYWKPLGYLPIPLGLLLFAAGQVFERELLVYQIFALLFAIAAPSLATIQAFEWLQKQEMKSSISRMTYTFGSYFYAAGISLIGAIAVVSLLNDVVFVQYLEQFRGVKLLYIAPMILVAIFLAVYTRSSLAELWNKTVVIWNRPIHVKHMVIAVLVLGVGVYYLTRSGNEAIILPFEMQLREGLNDLFGIRPRTKEIFLGHPLFILASYLVAKYRRGRLLFIIGVIGQLSMVSTFTHLHTPLMVSLLRTIYGLLIGAVIGVILIAMWEALVRTLWSKRERLKSHES